MKKGRFRAKKVGDGGQMKMLVEEMSVEGLESDSPGCYDQLKQRTSLTGLTRSSLLENF